MSNGKIPGGSTVLLDFMTRNGLVTEAQFMISKGMAEVFIRGSFPLLSVQ